MRTKGGFTVLETLIVFSITITLTATILAMFSQRQVRVDFTQGLRDIEAYIQDVANDVRNGYYPAVNQRCYVASINDLAFDGSAPTAQGASDACIFAGKLILFNSNDPNNSVITTYSLAGLKTATDVNTLYPEIIGQSLTETRDDYKMPSGIEIFSPVAADINKKSLLIGLLFNVTGVGVESTNARRVTSVTPYRIVYTGTDTSDNNVNNTIKTAFLPTNTALRPEINTAGGVFNICFKGQNNQNGIISLRQSFDGLSTSILINQNLATANCRVW